MSGTPAATHAADTPRERDSALVPKMLALLTLEPLGDDRFRAPGLDTKPRRIFGGHFLGQALAAATGTVEPDRKAHALLATFAGAGVTSLPLEFEVGRDNDTSNISFRRVVIRQEGKVLLSALASFQRERESEAHTPQMPDVPLPETLEDDLAQAAAFEGMTEQAVALANRASPFQFRSVELEQALRPGAAEASQKFWFRCAAPLPDDDALHRIVLTYVSDVRFVGAGLMPHGMRWFDGETQVASLNHNIWIHEPPKVDDWLYYEQVSPWAGGGRNLNFGRIFDRTGKLVASTAQEGSWRRVKKG